MANGVVIRWVVSKILNWGLNSSLLFYLGETSQTGWFSWSLLKILLSSSMAMQYSISLHLLSLHVQPSTGALVPSKRSPLAPTTQPHKKQRHEKVDFCCVYHYYPLTHKVHRFSPLTLMTLRHSLYKHNGMWTPPKGDESSSGNKLWLWKKNGYTVEVLSLYRGSK